MKSYKLALAVLSLFVAMPIASAFAGDQVFKNKYWSLVCKAADVEDSDCVLGQTVVPTDLDGLEFTMMFKKNEKPRTKRSGGDDAEDYRLHVFTPLNVPLSDGLHVSLDGSSLGALVPSTCDAEGCKFYAPLSREQAYRFREGEVASLRLKSNETDYIKIDFDLAGLETAFEAWINPSLRTSIETGKASGLLMSKKSDTLDKYVVVSYGGRKRCRDLRTHSILSKNDLESANIRGALHAVSADLKTCTDELRSPAPVRVMFYSAEASKSASVAAEVLQADTKQRIDLIAPESLVDGAVPK